MKYEDPRKSQHGCIRWVHPPPEGKGGGGGDAHLICNHVMISPAAGMRILFLTYLDFGILKTTSFMEKRTTYSSLHENEEEEKNSKDMTFWCHMEMCNLYERVTCELKRFSSTQTVTPCHHGDLWPLDPISGMFSPKIGWQKLSPFLSVSQAERP